MKAECIEVFYSIEYDFVILIDRIYHAVIAVLSFICKTLSEWMTE